MSIADIMNKNRIIEVPSIITGKHVFKNGNAVFNHEVDNNGHYHIRAADGTKLISYSSENTMNEDCILNAEINKNTVSIQSLISQVNLLKLYIHNLKEFISLIKDTVYLQDSNGREFDYNKIL
jgi:hypothetical protein